MTDSEPVVKITLGAIFERVVAVESVVTTVAGELRPHVVMTKAKQKEHDDRLNAHAGRLDSHDARLTRIEATQRPAIAWYQVAAGIGASLTSVATLIVLIGALSQLSTLS